MSQLKSIILIVLSSFIMGVSMAQQTPMYSQYTMNGFLLNPSFAGRDGATSLNLTVREQWVGLKNSPSTYAASFQTLLLRDSYISKSTSVTRKKVRPTKGGRVGLGGYLFNDNNGIMHRTGLQLAYAYHIPMSTGNDIANNLSFGLALNLYQHAILVDGLYVRDLDDPLLNVLDRRVFIPDFNFGVNYTTAKYYAGFAMTSLLRGAIAFADTSSYKRSEIGHYYLTGGIKIPVSPDWTIEPSAFIKASDMFFKSLQMDLTARAYYKNDYWAGLSWRTGDAIIVLLGLKYDRFYFAYAVDLTLTDIRKQSYGSHELTIGVKFGENARRFRWINAY